jgi:hypothetical protein
MLLAMRFIVAIDEKLIFTLLIGTTNLRIFLTIEFGKKYGIRELGSEFLHAVMRDWAQMSESQ